MHKQYALSQLLKWRELRARETNKIRKHVLTDEQAIDIAHHVDSITAEKLAKTMNPNQRKYHFAALWVFFCTLLEKKESVSAILPAWRDSYGMHLLRKLVAKKAHDLGLEASLLASKKQITALIYYSQYNKDDQLVVKKPDLLLGWRRSIIGEELLNTYLEYKNKENR